jgi:PBP1b-binding outer membrane lipoprotein LpoB
MVEKSERRGKPVILFLALLLSGCYPASVVETPKPDIYITRTDSYRTIEGDVIWMLEYTVNGIVQNPGFNSLKAMTEFREYLDTLGTVYQKEAE